ncbi:hypothetical protein [Streptomyces sp. NPDC005970]|uniref:hypothetical protein n=1 Tax=Streptomyces sp. NPDC005970 TaxID=3156723 RepID=UPI0033F64E7E
MPQISLDTADTIELAELLQFLNDRLTTDFGKLLHLELVQSSFSVGTALSGELIAPI